MFKVGDEVMVIPNELVNSEFWFWKKCVIVAIDNPIYDTIPYEISHNNRLTYTSDKYLISEEIYNSPLFQAIYGSENV